MEKRYDVVALGELLIDFTQYGTSEQGNPIWEANPGGAPCNLLAMLAKLDKKVSFIGKIGNDVYGRQLKEAVSKAGVGIEGLKEDDVYHTTLAIVSKLPNGDRDFAFYRNPGADMMLKADEVDEDLIAHARIFHFGTLSLTHAGVEEATKTAIGYAKKHNLIISFDPNMRPPLWDSKQSMIEKSRFGLGIADIVKISDNEIELLTGEKDIPAAADILLMEYPNIRLLTVTLGPDGSYCVCQGIKKRVDAYRVDAIETTGAGDTYGACILNYILEHALDHLCEDDLEQMMRFAGAAAAIITTKRGALAVMPSKADIEALMKA